MLQKTELADTLPISALPVTLAVTEETPAETEMRAFQGTLKIKASLLPMLDRWATWERLGEDPAVHEAAVACCEAIRHKTALTHSGTQLLRASDLPSPSSESLLRPLQGAQPTAPDELLRATITPRRDT